MTTANLPSDRRTHPSRQVVRHILKMRSFNFPIRLVYIFGLVLFKVQASEQYAVEVDQTGSDESVVEMQRSKSAICEDSMGGHKCVRLQTKCYCFVNTQLTWDKAQEFCSASGKSLLSITNKREQNDVSTVLMPIVLNDPIASKIGVWTSGNYNAGTKTFSWTAQTPFTFVNWFYGEPNNASGVGSDQCLHVRIVPDPSASWATLSCDQWMPFICQSDLEKEVELTEIIAIVNDLKREVEELRKILIESASQASINRIPQSCKDLLDIGHRKSGLYSVMGNKHVETVYCDFTKYPNTPDFQKWIGYEDVKSVSTYFYVQKNDSFNTKNTPIPFEMEMTNTSGEAMNITSGKFTAPRTGTYYFSFTGLAQFPISDTVFNFLQVQMLLNGNLIGSGQNNEANLVKFEKVLSPITLQSTLHLQKGDQLWLQIGDGSTDAMLFDSGNHSTHFTGFLIEEEIDLSL